MGIGLSPRINNHGLKKKRDSSCWAFLDAFCRVPPSYHPHLPTPCIMPIGQGQHSNGQSFPANAKRNTTKLRKRPMKRNSVVPDMPRVMPRKGKRVNTGGSEALGTRGVQFNRETLLEDTKDFHGWITCTV